jgi:hypothetical protein
MSSTMLMSPYCARETTGGTSALPRTGVGEGVTVGDGATVPAADGLAVGVGLELAGAVQAPTTSAAVTSRTAFFTGLDVRSPSKSVSERRRESDRFVTATP